MASLGTLSVFLTANTSKFNRSMSNAQKRIGQFTRLSSTAFIGAGTAFTAATVAIGKRSVRLASDAEEINAKYKTVFNNIGAKSQIMAKELAKNYGLAGSSAKSLMGDTGDLLTGFGFGQEQALNMSSEVNKLAVDLASFTNFSGGAAGASRALTKALLGERESIKSLGISILENDVKTRVALNTQKGMTFETERQAKAFATLQLAQEQSTNAIGDYARTKDGLANIERRFSEQLKESQEQLGKFITKTLQLPEAFGRITDKLSGLNAELDSGMFEFFQVEAAAAFTKIHSSAKWLFDNVMAQITWLDNALPKIWNSWLDIQIAVWKDSFNFGTNVFTAFINNMVTGAEAWFSFLKNGWKSVFEFILSGGQTDLFGSLFENAKSEFANFAKTAKSGFVKIAADFGSETEKAMKKAGVAELKLRSLDDLKQEWGLADQYREQENNKIVEKMQAEINKAVVEPVNAKVAPKGSAAAERSQSVKFAGAVEKGSVEAYRAGLGGKKTDKKIEKNTAATVTILKLLYSPEPAPRRLRFLANIGV